VEICARRGRGQGQRSSPGYQRLAVDGEEEHGQGWVHVIAASRDSEGGRRG
jgi:hypothetical protein